jgi:hypothetical protein
LILVQKASKKPKSALASENCKKLRKTIVFTDFARAQISVGFHYEKA